MSCDARRRARRRSAPRTRPTSSMARCGVSPVMGTLVWAWTLVARRAAAGRATASKPSRVIVPDVGRSRPTTWLTRVLLPAPLCPSRPTTWPEATLIETESLARTVRAPEPKCL